MPYICLSDCLSVHLSVLSVRPSVCPCILPSVHLPARLSVCLSVRPSVCLSVCPSFHSSVCLSVPFPLSSSPSLPPSLSAVFAVHTRETFSFTIFPADGKSGVVVASSSHLTYFNGQISMTYGASLNFTFECDQDSTGRETGPSCEKKGNKYECRWPTVYACRPLVNVQCSVRNEDGGVVKQYDFLPLSKNMNNWQARITDINLEGISYFINVCRTVVLPKEGDAKLCPPTAGVCMVKGYVHLLWLIFS